MPQRNATVPRRRLLVGVIVMAIGSLTVSACTSDTDTPDASYTREDIEAALQEETTLTVWSFSSEMVQIAEAFQEQYPAVTVEVSNPADIYTNLQNAIDAGSGAPDIATIEYAALPQFALSGALVDLNQFGFGEYGDRYSPSVWSSVNVLNALTALPRGDGPMALFYNEAVFDSFGIPVPETWEDYVAAAEAMRTADPTVYITNDTGDPALVTGLMWQAGGHPFQVEGDDAVTVNLDDEGSQRFVETWNRLLTNDLLAPIPSWSDEWYRGLSEGKIASVISGAWMAGNLPTAAADGEGDWRVAPLPAFDENSRSTGVWGGGGEAIISQSENQLAAAGFLEFVSLGEGAQISLDLGFFPSTVAELESSDFLDAEPSFFGGQQVNLVLADAAANVAPDWEFLPFQLYANSVFGDTVGQSYANKSDLSEGLRAWQDRIVEYGEQQGFTMTQG